jgi:uncharacterized protein (TIGR03437 family)
MKVVLLFAALLAPLPCMGQAGIITTFAGGGSLTGNAANGARSTDVRLMGGPLSVGTDSAGNVYIVDGGASRVWKASPAGVITTAAGGPNINGDGGPATSAQVFPSGVAFDSAGNMYISGNALRKVTPAGIISTVAQVNASNVAVDGAGNVYLADILSAVIRKVDPAGNVTTVAGSGKQGFTPDGGRAVDAALSLPQGVAADAAGNVYFCDAGNARVRKVDTAGILTTVAGNGSGLSLGDGGPATKAGMTPAFLAVDRDGNIYIADTGGGRIRKVNTAGIITTVAGGGLPLDTKYGDGGPATSAFLGGPRSVAVDGAGNLYIGDDGHSTVRKVSSGASGSPVQVTPGSLSFSYTPGGAVPPSQMVVMFSLGSTLTFTAATSAAWLSVNPTSGNVNNTLTISVSPVGLAPGSYTGTVTITPSGAGNPPQTINVKLTVNGPESPTLISTVAGTGLLPFTTEGGAATSTTLAANAVAADSTGNFYIADTVSNRVYKVGTGGTLTVFAGNGTLSFAGDGGPATRASLFNPFGLAADTAGNVYIADALNNRVRRVNASGTISTFAGTGGFSFSGDGGQAASAGVASPSGLAVDSSGNLYIADFGNNRVRKVNTAGVISTYAGGAPVPGFSGDGGKAVGAGLFGPGGLAIDAVGNLYIADIANNRIRKVDAAGNISTVAGNGTKGFSGDGGPATSAMLNLFSVHVGLAVDGAGNLYIPDVANHRVRKVDSSGTITTVVGTGIASFSGDNGPPASAGLNNPNDVSFDGSGNLYIADTTNNRVRKVTGVGAAAPPAISSNGVVNGASFQPGLISNSWATIVGSGLSPVTDTWANFIVNGKLPTNVDNVTVSVGGKPAYLYYVSPAQINMVAPDVPARPTQVTVSTPSGTSSTFIVTAAQFGPAFFPWPGSQAVATRQDFSFAVKNGTFSVATTPAKPGDVIILWGTGFGPTLPAAPSGVQIPSDATYSTATLPQVTINNVTATVYGAALAPGFAGLYQIAIQVPASLPDGDWPVVATIGGVSSPGGVLLSVKR